MLIHEICCKVNRNNRKWQKYSHLLDILCNFAAGKKIYIRMNNKIKAALFDLDGVVFNTEPQYTLFWREECERYYPGQGELEKTIKGTTLQQTFAMLFSGALETERPIITERLNRFEQTMHFDYVAGFREFLDILKSKGVLTAIVTSSNHLKMANVYRSHPDFQRLFDAILTAEDFSESKPHPDCYLRAAARLGIEPAQCVVLEDSFNGLKSGRAAGATVVALATTNAVSDLEPLADMVISDYHDPETKKIFQLFGAIQ